MKLIEDFNAIPSLEFLTASQVVIVVWNRGDVVRSISAFLEIRDETRIEGTWRKIEDRVKSIVLSIEQIHVLKRDMEVLIITIGFQIRALRTFISYSPHLANIYDWVREDFEPNDKQRAIWLNEILQFGYKLSDFEFPVNYWTSYGTVDTRRFDETLVLNKKLDICYRYNLACIDCFEEVIRFLYPKLGVVEKICFESFSKNRELQSYWTNRVSGRLEHFQDLVNMYYDTRNYAGLEIEDQDFYSSLAFKSVHELAFKFTLRNGSKSGFEYFENTLSPDVFNDVIKQDWYSLGTRPVFKKHFRGIPSPRPREHFTDTFYFVLSKMHENYRNEYLRNYTLRALDHFLKYPFYGLFSTYSKNLKIEVSTALLLDIFKLESINMYLCDYDLFKDLWCSHSNAEQQYIKQSLNKCKYENLRRGILERIRKLDENEKGGLTNS